MATQTPPMTARLLDWYWKMLLIRRFEERAEALYTRGELYGSLHLCIGQEATAVGACSALRPDDYMTCTYRGHGAALAKGLSPQAAMAELFGRQTGCSGGLGGSMFFTDHAGGNLGGNGIVAAGIPIAAGAALAAKLSRSGRVALTFFGDGAVNQGAFHEALNMAAVWDLPCVFICENNGYAEMTPIDRSVKMLQLTRRAEAYGIPGVVVDGNDVGAVHDATADAAARARAGDGSTFIEATTYRLSGHMVGDAQTYRTREEVDSWRRRDPIVLAAARLRDSGVDEETIAAIDREVLAVIDDAEAFARESPEPTPEILDRALLAQPGAA